MPSINKNNKEHCVLKIIPTTAQIENELAKRDFTSFALRVMPELEMTDFHKVFYRILNRFAHAKIKRLIVSVPPQHGKSLGASRLLPAYILGIDPNLKICIGSYSMALARKFNIGVQRTMAEKSYAAIFPESAVGAGGGTRRAVRNSEEFEVTGTEGGLKAAGRGSALTGNRVDVMILDDLYKNAMEANSPVIRENAWDWYLSVVKTRLHNDSRELIVFTRWHDDDLIGRLEKNENVLTISSEAELDEDIGDKWVKLNFEALKEGPATDIDPRRRGEALWESRHSGETLRQKRRLDPVIFDAMYEGRSSSSAGVLYGDFGVYTTLPSEIVRRGSYTDTADRGTDKLCSVCYSVGADGRCYVTDIIYTAEPMEITEEAVGMMLVRNATDRAYIESNNGGRGFARVVAKMAPRTSVESFHQGHNKEARVLTAASKVVKYIVMPADWRVRWGDFADDVTGYRRDFRANRFHDAPDVLTGIVEMEVDGKEVESGDGKRRKTRIRAVGFKN